MRSRRRLLAEPVNPGVALCGHLAALAPGTTGFTCDAEEAFVWLDGPVEAIVRCNVCRAPGWIELLDWSSERSVRAFALAGLRAGDVALYLRNVKKGSCDPQRERAEREALVAAAGPFERVVAWHAGDGRVLAVAPLAEHERLPSGDWPARLAAAGAARWLARLGLEPRAGA